MPTLRQERLAENLLDPTIKTKTAAMIKAGYSPLTAEKVSGRTLGAVGTEQALVSKQTRHSDKARSLLQRFERQLDKSARALERLTDADLRDPATIIGVAKGVQDLRKQELDIRERLGIQDNPVALELWKLRRRRLQAARAGVLLVVRLSDRSSPPAGCVAALKMLDAAIEAHDAVRPVPGGTR